MAHAETAAGPAAYVVAYLEAGTSRTAEAAALLRQIAAASRHEAGNAFYDVFEEIGRPTRFAVVSGWYDKAAIAAHQRAVAASGLAAKLQALLASPPDVRPSTALAVAPATARAPTAVYVLTHVDVVPPAKDRAIGLLERLAEDSRKESGVLFFDVLQQDSRPNHLTLFAAWRSPQAFEAHRTAANTRAFRDALLPLQGALYDERLYRALE